MYLWTLAALKRDLRRGLTPRQSFSYLMALALLPSAIWLAMGVPPLLALLWYAPEVNLTDEQVANAERDALIMAWVMPAYAASRFLVIGLGLVWCFAKNGGAGGVAFLERTIALAWVMCVRVLVLLVVPLFFAIALVRGAFEEFFAWS